MPLFKCDPVLAEELRVQYKDVIPGYHMSKKHWNTVTIDGDVPEDELKTMIDNSYALVYKSLTKAQKLELESEL
jgi:predicted DNA-binding protein (MmcQ/YjbR family)